MDEIYTFSRSSDHVDESKSTRLLRFCLTFGEDVRSFRSESKMGKSNKRISTVQFLQRITEKLMQNRLSSSAIFSQELRHWRFSRRRSRKTCKIDILNLRILKIESSSCQCSMISNGERKEIQNNVFQIPNKSRITREDSREDTGHSSALEAKRNGMELTVVHMKENGIPPPHRWWNDSKKPVIIQYS